MKLQRPHFRKFNSGGSLNWVKKIQGSLNVQKCRQWVTFYLGLLWRINIENIDFTIR